MKIEIVDDYNKLSEEVAHRITRRILNEPASTLGLATGNTPKKMYEYLVYFTEEDLLTWSDISTFNLDEYYPIDPDNRNSFHYYMNHQLFDHIDIDPEQVHIPDGTAEDVQDECASFEQAIQEHGGIDLQLLGIGTNGHIGFNEPGTDWSTLTHPVELTEKTIRNNFDHPEDAPERAITMGIRTIMNSRRILLMASGKRKAEIVRDALEGPITKDVPASILQLHPDVTVYLDESAASSLDGQ